MSQLFQVRLPGGSVTTLGAVNADEAVREVSITYWRGSRFTPRRFECEVKRLDGGAWEPRVCTLAAVSTVSNERWLHGYACALATLVRSHGVSTEIRDALGCVGGYDNLVKAGCDPHDLEALEAAR